MWFSKGNSLFLVLIVLISSCSKRIEGVYSAKGSITKSNRQFVFEKHLQLNKDSTFSYLEWYKSQDAIMPDGILEKVPAIKFIGKGTYSVERKNLILSFFPKIRRIDTIEVSSLTTYDESGLWEQINGVNKKVEGKFYVFILMNIDGYYFGSDESMMGGYVKVNDNRIYPGLINFFECDEKQFPLTLNLDFNLLHGQDRSDILRLLFSHEKALGRNLGYQDEAATLLKPGNYKIEIHPALGANIIDSQVFNGKKSFAIKSTNGVTQIGEMIKQSQSK